MNPVFNNIIPVIINAVRMLFIVLYGMLLVRVLLSWLPAFRNGRIVSFIFAFTEPMLAPIRRLIDRSPLGGPGMMLDFSPIIAILFLQFAERFMLSLLRSL